MFETWAEGLIESLRNDARKWPEGSRVAKRIESHYGLVAFILASYRESGAQAAADWCEWFIAEGASNGDRFAATSCLRVLMDCGATASAL